MDEAKVYAHLQKIAVQFNAWRGRLPALIEFLRFSMGADAPETAALDHFLRKESTQRELVKFEVALWRGPDKSYRLISLAVTGDPEVARRRLAHKPTSATQCSWCHQDEKSFAPVALRPELNIFRNPVPCRFLHPQCAHSWELMRRMVERDDLTARNN
ncbi:hypothetical protein ACUTAF_19595 [Pseudomonas sp. SP16.1]|uniref:hypothetical protein n=1 Tax=Pseudomonas sp. SP16.1 TaxID=3458854 RepID=UPI0040456BC8